MKVALPRFFEVGETFSVSLGIEELAISERDVRLFRKNELRNPPPLFLGEVFPLEFPPPDFLYNLKHENYG